MAPIRARIQVCGRLAVVIDGTRIDGALPGRQGRLLLTYLVLHRHGEVGRRQLVEALWPDDPPAAAETAVYALLSKLRAALGPELLAARGAVRLTLPPGTWVDLEAARDAVHRSESALAQGEWGRAWGAAQISLFASRRGFLSDEDVEWAVPVRRELAEIHLRALETYAAASLQLGGAETATAERASRELVGLAPFRESAHRLLMRSLAARGNTAEALLAFEQLRRSLREELGVPPSEATRQVHVELLGGPSAH